MYLPAWVQVLALFGLPALGVYTGMRVALAEIKGDMRKLEATTALKFDGVIDRQEEHLAEIRILRKRSHQHSNILGRLALKVNLTGGFHVTEEDTDA